MAKFRELHQADLRKINGLTRRMVQCKNLAELEVTFVSGALKCVPMDYLGWNLFNRDRTEVIYVGSTEQLMRRAVELLDEANGYLLDWHPILSTVGWAGVEKRLATMTDFQTIGEFRRAPLYRYAYRHLDADYQAAESVGTYGNLNLTMTYNRRLRDFTRREREILHLLNRRLDSVAAALYRHEQLQARLNSLNRLSGNANLTASNLTTGEIQALGSLVREEPIRRDVGASLREKLALKSSKQLVSLVNESMRPPAPAGDNKSIVSQEEPGSA